MADTTERPRAEAEGGSHLDGAKPRLADTGMAPLLVEAGRIFAQNNQPRPGYPEGKYPDIDGRPNYQAGIKTTRLLDSALRHLLALIQGEDADPDSGFDHAGHLLCNLIMFWWTRANRPDLDDRPRLFSRRFWPDVATERADLTSGPLPSRKGGGPTWERLRRAWSRVVRRWW